jgi:hypothetical protein
LADLKISKACWNIYRRISSGVVIAWHGRNELRDTTGLPFASLTRIDKNVRAPLPPGTCSLGSERAELLQYREKSEGENTQTNRLSMTDRGFANP